MNSYNRLVVKRNGSVVKFDPKRIESAIEKSFISLYGEADHNKIESVIENIDVPPDDVTLSVEGIQDIVESALMSSGFHDVARSYILYRQKHSEIRSTSSEISDDIKMLYNKSKHYFDNQLAEFVFYRSYSRWLPEKSRRETWPETVNRYMIYMQSNLGSILSKVEYRELECAILNHDIMPSMRLLWSSGPANARDHASGYNCTYTTISNLNDFAEIAYLSMCGSGCGFSVSRLTVNRLPLICRQTGLKRKYVIEDSKEGWADSITYGLESWFNGDDVDFDYSSIRPSGSRLKIMGGKSSGPVPLRALLLFIKTKVLTRQGSKLSTLDVHDIVCKIGEIVVSGGVRRTALISLSDLDDHNIRDCKAGQFYLEHMQRSFSNNSAIYDKKPSSGEFLDEWLALLKSGSGERGIFNRGFVVQQAPERRKKKLLENIDNIGVNPCLHGDTLIRIQKDGIKYVPIRSICIGDLVESYDIDRGEIVYNKVIKSGLTACNVDIVSSSIKTSEDSLIVIKHTIDHKFFNTKNGEYGKSQIGASFLVNKYDIDEYKHVLGSVTSVIPIGRSDVYNITVEDTHCYFANGILSKNCGEINLVSKEMCNLSEVIARADDTEASLREKIRLATILGTYQSTLTDFRYISDKWKTNMDDERLLGVSITGQWDCDLVRHPILLNELRDLAIKVNTEYSNRFNIRSSAAVTCTKPSGTVAILTNSAAGMHARYAPYYIRRVRISATDSLFKMLRDQGLTYYPEVGQEIESCNTYVIEFPIKSPEGSIFQSDLTAIDQLNHWKMVKVNYTEHNPSVTIMISEDEWVGVASWVYSNWKIVGGLAFLPRTDHNYKLAPYEEIDEETYNNKLKEMPELDFSRLILYETTDETSGAKEVACSGGRCDII